MEGKIALLIKGARKSQRPRMTQEDLARKVNVTESYIGHIEQGKRIPSDDKLLEICRVLGMHRDAIMACVDAKHSKRRKLFDSLTGKSKRSLDRTNSEMIQIAIRQGLIIRENSPVYGLKIEALKSMHGTGGHTFASPKAAAKAYKELSERPIFKLLEAAAELPPDEQEELISIAEYKRSKHRKKK